MRCELRARCAAGATNNRFIDYISGRSGDLAIDDPELAADQLIGAWLGMTELRQSLGVAGPPSSNAIAKRVRYAIDTLIRAWSTGAEPRSAHKKYKAAGSGRRPRST
jgi:TetR/AcrR family transcriptional repressor of mexJK operon